MIASPELDLGLAAERPEDRAVLRAAAREVCEEVFTLPPRLSVSAWADEHRRLPSTSAEPGRFRTARIPYMRRIQDVLGAPDVREVVFAKSSQVAGSTVGENFVGYLMHLAPCGILEVWPTEKKLRAWTQTRLDPMIDDSPVLRKLFRRTGRRESGDSLDKKIFPLGWLMAITAKSTSDLKSAAARVAIAEEVDEWEGDVGDQGDPLELLRVRMRTFRDAKLFIVSTPTLDGFSRVWSELQASTWEEYWVPCPHCQTYQTLRWRDGEGDDDVSGSRRLIWEKDADGEPIPGTCTYVCEQGCEIQERHKTWMLDRGEWRARFPGRRTLGFHINTLYSPLCPWDDMAAAFRRAVRNPGQMKVFVNTWCGLPYAEKGQTIDAHFLKQRAESYGAPVPNGVGLLTAGVDVQGDRLELFVWGWGADEESWLITWEQLEGDPGIPYGKPGSPWTELAKRLMQAWQHEGGGTLQIASMAIDAGYQTESVHRFCDLVGARGAFAVVGRDGARKLLTAPAAKQPQKWKRAKKERRPTHVVGVDSAKDLLSTRLRVEQPGPGYVHFPEDVDPVFYEQLTAEKLVTRYRKKRPMRVWEPMPNRRTEALDGAVYAMAALAKLGVPTVKRLRELADSYRSGAGKSAPVPRRGKRRRGVISSGIS